MVFVNGYLHRFPKVSLFLPCWSFPPEPLDYPVVLDATQSRLLIIHDSRYETPRVESETALRRTVADCIQQTRQDVDPDDPSIEGIQTLLLLSLSLYANGQGKKAYMALSKDCVSSAQI